MWDRAPGDTGGLSLPVRPGANLFARPAALSPSSPSRVPPNNEDRSRRTLVRQPSRARSTDQCGSRQRNIADTESPWAFSPVGSRRCLRKVRGTMKRLAPILLVGLAVACGGDDGPTAPTSYLPYGLWSRSGVQLRIDSNGAWTVDVQAYCVGTPSWSRSGFLQKLDGRIIDYTQRDATDCYTCAELFRLYVDYDGGSDQMTINTNYTACGCDMRPCLSTGSASRVQ